MAEHGTPGRRRKYSPVSTRARCIIGPFSATNAGLSILRSQVPARVGEPIAIPFSTELAVFSLNLGFLRATSAAPGLPPPRIQRLQMP